MAGPTLAEQIIGANDIELKEIEVPEWGVTVWIRKLSHAQGLDVLASISGDDADVNNVMLTMLLFALCDEAGTRLFSEEQREGLGSKSNHVIKRLFTEAQEFNALGTDAEEEIAGN